MRYRLVFAHWRFTLWQRNRAQHRVRNATRRLDRLEESR